MRRGPGVGKGEELQYLAGSVLAWIRRPRRAFVVSIQSGGADRSRETD
jgi:hypothetical protein